MPQNLTTTTEPGAANAAPLPPPSDADLLERFVGADDEAAFAGMVARYGPMVLQVCRSVLRSEADADDAFQAVFLQLARKASGIRRAGALPAWLHRTAQRTAVYALKRRMKYTRQTVALPAEPIAREIEAVAARQLRWTVHEQIARLSESSRTALLLYYFAGTTAREAAEQLGISEEAFKGRLRRARASLARRLATAGASVTAAAALLDGAAAQSVAGLSGAQAATGCAAVVSNSMFGGSASFTAASPSALSLAEGVTTLMLTETIAKTAAVVAVIAAAATTGAVGVWADDQAAQASASSQTLVAAADAAPASEATPVLASGSSYGVAGSSNGVVGPSALATPVALPVPSEPPIAPSTPAPAVGPQQADAAALPTPYLQLVTQLASAQEHQLPAGQRQQQAVAAQQVVEPQQQVNQVAQLEYEALQQRLREALHEIEQRRDEALAAAKAEFEQEFESRRRIMSEAYSERLDAQLQLEKAISLQEAADIKAKLKAELDAHKSELQKVKLDAEDVARSAKLAAQQAHLDREMMQLEYERKMLAEQQAAFDARRNDQEVIRQLESRLSQLEAENQRLREQLESGSNSESPSDANSARTR